MTQTCRVRPPKINVKDDGELHGNCLKPTIANGVLRSRNVFTRAMVKALPTP